MIEWSRKHKFVLYVGTILILVIVLAGMIIDESGNQTEPTAKKTKTKEPVTFEGQVKEALISSFGKKEIKEITINGEVVTVRLHRYLHDGRLSMDKRQIMRNTLKATEDIFKLDQVEVLNIIVDSTFLDRYGKEFDRPVFKAQLKRTTAEKIQWENMQEQFELFEGSLDNVWWSNELRDVSYHE